MRTDWRIQIQERNAADDFREAKDWFVMELDA
jgi:hypothetical protein